MAELARTQVTRQPSGVPVREHLRTLDDGDVVSAFLNGEERAFEEAIRMLDGSAHDEFADEVFARGADNRSPQFSTAIVAG